MTLTANFKLSQQKNGIFHYAEIQVTVSPADYLLIDIAPSCFAWLKDVYGPDAWEWPVCDDYREAARRGIHYALTNRHSMQPLSVTVTHIYARLVDTSCDDIAYAACMACWNAIGEYHSAHPQVGESWNLLK